MKKTQKRLKDEAKNNEDKKGGMIKEPKKGKSAKGTGRKGERREEGKTEFCCDEKGKIMFV